MPRLPLQLTVEPLALAGDCLATLQFCATGTCRAAGLVADQYTTVAGGTRAL